MINNKFTTSTKKIVKSQNKSIQLGLCCINTKLQTQKPRIEAPKGPAGCAEHLNPAAAGG